jgi:hypothetical protein
MPTAGIQRYMTTLAGSGTRNNHEHLFYCKYEQCVPYEQHLHVLLDTRLEDKITFRLSRLPFGWLCSIFIITKLATESLALKTSNGPVTLSPGIGPGYSRLPLSKIMCNL